MTQLQCFKQHLGNLCGVVEHIATIIQSSKRNVTATGRLWPISAFDQGRVLDRKQSVALFISVQNGATSSSEFQRILSLIGPKRYVLDTGLGRTSRAWNGSRFYERPAQNSVEIHSAVQFIPTWQTVPIQLTPDPPRTVRGYALEMHIHQCENCPRK